MRVYVDYWHRHDPFQGQVSLTNFDTLERAATDEIWNDNAARAYAHSKGWEVVEKPIDAKDWQTRRIPQESLDVV